MIKRTDAYNAAANHDDPGMIFHLLSPSAMEAV
jgi:hypothetical protein